MLILLLASTFRAPDADNCNSTFIELPGANKAYLACGDILPLLYDANVVCLACGNLSPSVADANVVFLACGAIWPSVADANIIFLACGAQLMMLM